MPINRFYTPSLPEYTSQFVEDQTPWDEMIALENLKLDRTDQAMQSADQINTSLAQIIPGARTGPTAEAVKSEYSQAVEDWTKKHRDDSYSVPALRELTQINSRWKQDPRVTKIIRDREETPMYLQQRAQMDNRDIDPNVDPETGEIIPLSDDQEFQSFQPILRAADFEQQLRSDLMNAPITKTGENLVRTIEHDGQEIEGIVNVRKEKRGDDEMNPVINSAIEAIQQGKYPGSAWVNATLGPDATQEDLLSFLGGYTKMAEVDNSVDGSFSPLKTKEAEESKVPLNQLTGSKVPIPKVITPPLNNGIDFLTNQTGVDRSTQRKVKRTNRIENKLQPEYWDAKVNEKGFIPPEELLGDRTADVVIDGKQEKVTPFKENFFTKDSRQEKQLKSIIFNSLDNNYAETKASYKDFYTQYDNKDEFKEAGEDGSYWNYDNISKNLDDYLKEYDEVNGYDKPNKDIFKSDLNFTAARNAVIISGALNQTVDNPFDYGGEDPVTNFNKVSADEYTPEQQVWISKIYDNYSNSDRINTVTPTGISMSPDQKEFLEDLVIGKTTSANSSIPGQTLTGVAQAMRMIHLGNIGERERRQPDTAKELSKKERQDLLTESNDDDTNVRIGTWIDPETSPYGPGMYELTVGNRYLAAEAPEEFVEPQRLSYNIGSAGWSHSVGTGGVFAVQGYGTIENTGEEYVKVLDQWNKERVESNPMTDLWMQVQHDNANNMVNLLVYNQNPDALDDRPQLNEDYIKVPLKSTLDGTMKPEDLETLVEHVYMREMMERSREAYRQTGNPEMKSTADDWRDDIINLVMYNQHLFEIDEDTGTIMRK